MLPSPAKAGRQAEMREREETSGSGAWAVDDNHGCPAHVGFLALEIAPALSPSDPRDLVRDAPRHTSFGLAFLDANLR